MESAEVLVRTIFGFMSGNADIRALLQRKHLEFSHDIQFRVVSPVFEYLKANKRDWLRELRKAFKEDDNALNRFLMSVSISIFLLSCDSDFSIKQIACYSDKGPSFVEEIKDILQSGGSVLKGFEKNNNVSRRNSPHVFISRSKTTYKRCVKLGDERDDLEFAMTEEEFNRAMKNRGKTYPSRVELKWKCLKDPTHGTFRLSVQRMVDEVQRKCPKCPIVKTKARLKYKDCVELGNGRNDLEFAMTKEEFNRAMKNRGEKKPSKIKLRWKCLKDPTHGTWKTRYDIIKQGSGCPLCAPKAEKSYQDYVDLGNERDDLEFAMAKEEFQKVMHKRGSGTDPSRVYVNWRCTKNPYHGTWNSTWDSISRGSGCVECIGISYEDCVELGNGRNDLEFAMTKEEFQKAMHERGNIQKSRVGRLKWRCKVNPNHIWETSFASIRDGSGCPLCGQRVVLVGTYIHPILEYYSLLLLSNSGITVNYEHCIKSDDFFHPDLLIYCTEVFKERLSSFQDVLSISDSIKEISLDFTYSLNLTVMLEKCNKYYQAQTRYLIIVLLREGTKLNADYFQNEIEHNSSVKFVENIKIINFETFLKYISELSGQRVDEVLNELTKVRDFGIKAFRNDKAFKSLRNTSEQYKKKLASDFKNFTN
ncbi:MAG: hypothetical protein ACQERB_03805 [Promethearchaeati archaeon]